MTEVDETIERLVLLLTGRRRRHVDRDCLEALRVPN
jgi:hypothetical protein